MHMADALISPAVGGTMWAASSGLAIYSATRLARQGGADYKAPMMGVLGAFVFSAQMINFTIPMTGSSGHLGGGLLLAILLGPHAAFLTMFSILLVQALFFADGGLLALGCNVFNLGFFPCFVAYPLIYKPLAGGWSTPRRIALGSILAAIISLAMGAMGVVLETKLSGISDLPFGAFAVLMLAIHLAIGLVEGLITAGLISFVLKVRPEVLDAAGGAEISGGEKLKGVALAFLAAAAVTGGVLSWFASTCPDGLEWSMLRVAGKEELEPPEGSAIHAAAAAIQEKTAFMPDYDFSEAAERSNKEPPPGKDSGGTGVAGKTPDALGGRQDATPVAEETERWPSVSAGASLAGLVGGAITLLVAGLIGFLLRLTGRPSTG
ncbi:MAG: energy-coupling factor ABC transporter permease [Planctomycetota bacterium]|nr:energy-coupling factor ABC transporter permease [Planctomycetota bacterium]